MTAEELAKLNKKLIDFEGASKLYDNLRQNIEAGDSAQSAALTEHKNATNPHNITKSTIGLENAENTKDSEKNVATATKWANARTVKFDGTTTDVTGEFTIDGSANISDINLTVKDDSHNHVIGNIDGLQDALNTKFNSNDFGTSWTSELDKIKAKSNGLATLDENGTVPSSQLPSYVDDVIEVKNLEALKALPTPEANKIYVTTDDNKTYRWTGTAHNFVVISEQIALGETASTAYAGDKGKKLADALGTKGAASDTTAFGLIKKNADALGTINVSNDTTAFGKIKKLEDAVGGTGGSSLTDLVEGLRTDLGQTSDAATKTTTAFGRIKKTEEDLAKIDLTKDSTKNVLTATKWATARDLELTGDVTGKATGVDGSANISITTTIDGTKHTHTTAQITDFSAKHAEKLNTDTFETQYTNKLGKASGVATLDAEAKIASTNLHIATPTEIQTNIIESWKASTV